MNKFEILPYEQDATGQLLYIIYDNEKGTAASLPMPFDVILKGLSDREPKKSTIITPA